MAGRGRYPRCGNRRDAPPASGLPARLVLGPALRAQSDGRLVRLVREGYESAFDEIVRRYRRPLDRFAASIVGGHSEDVIQDSFRKALVALRRGDTEVDLRPWLYRIVRNTALNDLRDRPPAAAELADDLIGGGRSAAVEAEERAEVEKLTARLRALPERQRAALVMRELEGMSHEEIAASLGISGGAARQAIARGRAAVRSGFGALVPLPLLRVLASSGDSATEAAAGAGAAAGGAGGLGSALSGADAVGAGGLGAGALKVGLAAVVVAGSIGAGVAVNHHGGNHGSEPPQAAAAATGGPSDAGVGSTPSPVIADVGGHGGSSAEGIDDGSAERSRGDHDGGGDDGHRGSGRGDDGGHGGNDSPAPVPTQAAPADGPGPSHGGGPGPSPGRGGPDDDSGPSHGGDSSGSGGSGSGRSDGGKGRGGSADAPAQGVGTAPTEGDTSGSGSSNDSGSSSSGGSRSSDGSGSSGGSEISP